VLARSHALSGAAGWLGLCAAASPVAGLNPTWVTVGSGLLVATGAALLPDVDHTGSRVARALGPPTRVLARVVSWVSDAARDATCRCCRTKGTHGHRTLTHTLLVAALTGLGLCLAGRQWGLGWAAGVVGVGAWLAGLGLLRDARRGDRAARWATATMGGVTAGLAVWWLGSGLDWWWLGIPAGWGMLVHSLGDALTKGKVPLFGLLVKIRGCWWYKVGLPDWLTFRTGGDFEKQVVAPALALAGLLALGVMLWDPYLAVVWDVGRQVYAGL
jgi:membrane-bound metal-dependent hydrolase YbcI (DUF457 family)